MSELEGELVGDAGSTGVVGLAGVEHEGVRVSDDSDRGASPFGTTGASSGSSGPMRPRARVSSRGGGCGRCLPQIAADRGREPGETVGPLRRQLEHVQIADRRPDDLRRHDAADAGPVRVLPAVERALGGETARG